ncbi:MAG: sulfatase [Kiritimatiellia bacterium]
MASKHPNVLFVVSDDLRCQLGCYGRDWIHSPRLDEFAEQGILFERAYCQQSVCAPSRASVLTGCRPDTTGIFDLKTPVRSIMPDVLTLPEHFKNNGYETISAGKVYHHGNDDLESWNGGATQAKGDWKGRGYLTDEAIEAVEQYNRQARARGGKRLGLGPAFEAADVPDEAYQDGMETLKTIAELERLAKEDKPFFLGYGLHKPHLPFNAPKRYWDIYNPQSLPTAANPFPPSGLTPFSLPMLETLWEIGSYTNMPEKNPIPEGLARQLIHGYSACVSYIDKLFGDVMAALERLDLSENTIVIVWGDHGWKLGEHACWCKHTNFEIDTRAPLMLRVPGRTKGQRTSALVEFVDMYPTLADLCGIGVPEHCEGLSMAPLIDDPGRSWKTAALSQYPRDNVMGYSMRTDRYRYTEWRGGTTEEVKAVELYDHENDPQENANIAQSAPSDLLSGLSVEMKNLQAKPDAGVREWPA